MPFTNHDGQFSIEKSTLHAIAAEHGTPCFVYSRQAIQSAYREFSEVTLQTEALICYAVKANSNLAILGEFARLGAGFDVVSGGELARVIAAGGQPNKVVFSGVGKSIEELKQALQANILCFNVESESELERLNRVAGTLQHVAPISFRVNPDVDAKTHPYISTGLKANKFGIPHSDAVRLYKKAATLPNVSIKGIDCHIGSQLLDPKPFHEALDKILAIIDELAQNDIELEHIDIGGGLGICYKEETAPTVYDYLTPILDKLAGRNLKVILEPGRRLIGNAGILLTKVEYLKQGETKNFAIIDAAMNDLARPALYDAWHTISNLSPNNASAQQWEIVGPICETGDFLGHDRTLAISEGDILAIHSAGAYGMAMSSNYNSRPRAAEVMVDKTETHLIRNRETVESLFANEHMLKK